VFLFEIHPIEGRYTPFGHDVRIPASPLTDNLRYSLMGSLFKRESTLQSGLSFFERKAIAALFPYQTKTANTREMRKQDK
jgi:hypothetical protein